MCVYIGLARGAAPLTPARRDGGVAPAETPPSMRPSPGRAPAGSRAPGHPGFRQRTVRHGHHRPLLGKPPPTSASATVDGTWLRGSRAARHRQNATNHSDEIGKVKTEGDTEGRIGEAEAAPDDV